MFALAVAHLPLFSAPVERALFALGTATMGYTVLEMFVKAVVAGWFIATMVWLMPAAESAWLWIIIGLTWLIAAAGLVHVIGSAGEWSTWCSPGIWLGRMPSGILSGRCWPETSSAAL